MFSERGLCIKILTDMSYLLDKFNYFTKVIIIDGFVVCLDALLLSTLLHQILMTLAIIACFITEGGENVTQPPPDLTPSFTFSSERTIVIFNLFLVLVLIRFTEENILSTLTLA
jgi:hypothetical protein